MKAKEFIPASKPRNFVAKNQKTAGAGAHKDKKRAEKQGDVKHKAKQYDESVEEGWKEKLAGAALAGTMALGAAGANARVTGDEDPGVNRLTGKPNVTQVAPSDSKPDSGPSLSSRYGPDYEGSPAAYTITVKGQDYKFAGRDKDGPGTGPIIKVPGGAVGIRGLSPVAVELGKDGTFYIAPK